MVSSTIQANLDSARGDSLHVMGHRRPMTWKEITINSRWNEWIVNCLKNRLNGACMSHSCRMMKHRTRTFPFNLVPVISSYYSGPLFVLTSELHAEQHSHDHLQASHSSLSPCRQLHLRRHRTHRRITLICYCRNKKRWAAPSRYNCRTFGYISDAAGPRGNIHHGHRALHRQTIQPGSSI